LTTNHADASDDVDNDDDDNDDAAATDPARIAPC